MCYNLDVLTLARKKSKEFNPLDNDNKYRNFFLLLYPDNPEHLKVIFDLQNIYKSVGICHDQDIYLEDVVDKKSGVVKHLKGDKKKKHFHFCLEVPNPRYRKGIAKEFDIEDRFVQVAENFASCKKYLLHWGYADKFQYDTNDLVGVLAPKLIKQLTELSEDSQIAILVNYIDSRHNDLSMRQLFDYAQKNGCLGTYRRWYSILSDFVYAGNSKIGGLK